MLDNLWLLLLLLVAIAIAWYLGYTSRARKNFSRQTDLSKDYFVGLNYLLHDEPDEAIDTFIKALEFNSETIDTHLALGTLLRRRGKVDRAIRVHQNILARPDLNLAHLLHVQLELSHSYIAAGLLDRAERLLHELVSGNREFKSQALPLLVTIYQLEKEWQKAVEAVEEYLKYSPLQSQSKMLAAGSHFYCQLAEQAIDKNDYTCARKHLKHASHFDKNNVRVSLLAGSMESSIGHHKEAIKEFNKIAQQDSNFISETVEPLVHCYQQMGNDKELQKYLQTCLIDNPFVTVIIKLADKLRNELGECEAASFIAQQLKQKPSLRAMPKLLDLQITWAEGQVKENLQLLKQILEKLVHSKPVYCCGNCGFETKKLYWLCPSCQQWGGIKPILGIEGE